MAGVRWSQTEDIILLRLHGEHRSLNSIAKEMGRSLSTVSEHGMQLGLDWDRSRVIEMNIARMADAAAIRTALELDLLRDAERLRQQLFSPAVAYNFGGKDNTYEEHRLPQPSAADQLKIMQATTIAVAHSLKISEHDVNAGTDAAIGMLDKVAIGIQMAALDLAIEASP